MKIYFNLCVEGFTNSYVVVNDDPAVMEALIIDPGKISSEIIDQIERGRYELTGVLITHNHTNHVQGLSILKKIYSPCVYAADYDVAGEKSIVLSGNGEVEVAGLNVKYYSVPGHSSDSMVYRIGNVLFTGDTLTSGIIGETSSKYSKKLLRDNIVEKLYSQTEATVLMPGHGPPSTIAGEKQFNLDIPYQLN
ncbi:MAG: MBL fold metallo-hydrolase [Treponema sp.]|nr:MBL fold metallo-hydrolase [Treponema sp.]MCR5620584.1 MBL fold metallo-hydrolase [Treponema sp.]